MNNALDTLREWTQESDNIVFFGGAGVSTESGIPDFRGTGGLYRQTYAYPPETILSHRFFEEHTEEFFRFYKEKMLLLDAKPNPAHRKLAQWEELRKLRAVITQNIDGLHQAAGSREVLELHGSVHRNYCTRCGAFYDAAFMKQQSRVPHCTQCEGIVKPDVVLYGEGLCGETMERAMHYIRNAEVLIIGGTSLAVYPAAGLVTHYRGKKLVLMNRDATPYDSRANLTLNLPIGEALGSL